MKKDFRFFTADEREALYKEVWAEPVTTVAKRYGMSGNGLKKHCLRLGIPLPPPGYWARIRAGQNVKKPPLPKVTGELKKHVRQYVIKYRDDIQDLSDTELINSDGLCVVTEDTKMFIQQTCSQIQVKSQLRNPHHLILEYQEEMAYRKRRDRALKQASSFNLSYYMAEKDKYRENKATLPINISESNLNRALRILNAMMVTLEEMEGSTNVRIEDGKDISTFSFMRTEFRFDFKEEAPKKTASKENTPPLLVLSMVAQSWFRRSETQQMKYKDRSEDPLEAQLGRIVHDMFVTANELLVQGELKKREEEREWERIQRKWRLEEMRKGELKEVAILEQAASDWDKAEKIRRFADALERIVYDIADEEKRNDVLNWLHWARNKADWLDPLVDMDDELLGKGQYIIDLIDD